jgi:hypothetical protein
MAELVVVGGLWAAHTLLATVGHHACQPLLHGAGDLCKKYFGKGHSHVGNQQLRDINAKYGMDAAMTNLRFMSASADPDEQLRYLQAAQSRLVWS